MGIKFKIDSPFEDYCQMCQQLGPPEFGVKTHRSLPTQTWMVEGTIDDETKWFVLCSDCLKNACEADEVDEVLEQDGTPFTSKGKFFIRYR